MISRPAPQSFSARLPRFFPSIRGGFLFFLAALAAPTLLPPIPAGAAELRGNVLAVSDGDTLTVLDEARAVHKVRIAGIDAPERTQAFGERSKQNLSAMTFQKDARLECHKTDRYGRQICKVWVQPSDCTTCGQTLDVGHAQIVVGMAWWYREYANEQTPDDRGRYESSEREARLRRLGLWSAPYQMPPWDWRALTVSRPRAAPSPSAPGR